MTKKGKDLPSSEVQELKKVISKLKAQIKNLQKELSILKSDNKTQKAALKKNFEYIYGEIADFPVEDIIKEVNKKQKNKKKTLKDMTKALKEKWKCHECDTGYLLLIVFETPSGKKYFRSCSEKKCNNRTRLKAWNVNVEGLE